MVVGTAGCDSASPSVRPAAGAKSTTAPVKSGGPGKAQAPGEPSRSNSKAEMVSTIEGDRMTVVAPSIVLTKQTESSPFRFTEVAKEWGIDFVHFSGMTNEKYFPTANGSGVAIFDYDNDGLMDLYFATCTLLPLGTAAEGAEPALQEPGRREVQGRDRGLRAWASGGSATGSSSATSTTTAIRTCSCATRTQCPLPE